MDNHDKYGKQVLTSALGSKFSTLDSSVQIDYGAGLPARIDGIISGKVAVEIESRTSKQVRGAVLDLICHPFPKKLLVLLPVHMSNPEVTKSQCENIFLRFLHRDDFKVVLLNGSGASSSIDDDVQKILAVMKSLTD